MGALSDELCLAIPPQQQPLLSRNCTEAELEDLFWKICFGGLSKSGVKASILSFGPKYCEDFVPRIEKGDLPRPLTDLYNKEFFKVTELSDVLPECERVFSSVSISSEHCECIEKTTSSQSQSKLWYQYRAGRITASNFKNAVHTVITEADLLSRELQVQNPGNTMGYRTGKVGNYIPHIMK